jgi:hypothetical protein
MLKLQKTIVDIMSQEVYKIVKEILNSHHKINHIDITNIDKFFNFLNQLK